MNLDPDQDALKDLFEQGSVFDMLEKYISLCIHPCSAESEQDVTADTTAKKVLDSKRSKRQDKQKNSFPNLAGFCRYLKISIGEFEKISAEHPIICERILTVFEDEALNSELSATLISAYLKKRIGYDGTALQTSKDTNIQISFEHDIFEDGE